MDCVWDSLSMCRSSATFSIFSAFKMFDLKIPEVIEEIWRNMKKLEDICCDLCALFIEAVMAWTGQARIQKTTRNLWERWERHWNRFWSFLVSNHIESYRIISTLQQSTQGRSNLQTVSTVRYWLRPLSNSFNTFLQQVIARAQWRMWHRPISVPLSWRKFKWTL